jgi:hypothetical protein
MTIVPPREDLLLLEALSMAERSRLIRIVRGLSTNAEIASELRSSTTMLGRLDSGEGEKRPSTQQRIALIKAFQALLRLRRREIAQEARALASSSARGGMGNSFYYSGTSKRPVNGRM